MHKGSTLFLKGVVVLLGLAALALCVVVLPRIIGSISLGGYDPILLGMYISVIPFFIALYQSYKLFTYIDSNNAFSMRGVRALKYIKYSAISISIFYLIEMPYIFSVAEADDAPGVVAIGLVIIFASTVIATFAAVLQKLLQNVVEIKSENELTV